MANVISGEQFKDFYFSEDVDIWPDGAHIEEMTLSIDGSEPCDSIEDVATIRDDARIKITYGTVVFPDSWKSQKLTLLFKKWLDKQNSTSLVVKIPKEHQAALEAFVKGLGGKIN